MAENAKSGNRGQNSSPPSCDGAELAKGQGGSDGGEEKMVRFLKKGEEILDTFQSSIRAFEAQTLQFRALQETVNGLKRNAEETGADKRKNKKVKTVEVENESESEVDSEKDEIDQLMGDTDEEQHEEDNDDLLDNIDQFFNVESSFGEDLKEKVAHSVNNGLRGQADSEKMKKLLEKYCRPGNAVNLQVPGVDFVLWEQLKNKTKAVDSEKQRLIGALNQTLVPIVRAMDELHGNKTPDRQKLAEYVGDAFRLAAGQICVINKGRREAVKREMTPKFKSLCQSTPSATKLLGDEFTERVKMLDSQKEIKMTHKSEISAKQGSFLGKRGGDRFPAATSSTQSYPKQQFNFNKPQFQHQHQRPINNYQQKKFGTGKPVFKHSPQRSGNYGQKFPQHQRR